MTSRGRTTTPARLGVTDEFLRELWVAHFGVNCTFDRVTKLLEEVFEMSVFERRTGESLTDWTLRWMSGAPYLQKRAAQEVQEATPENIFAVVQENDSALRAEQPHEHDCTCEKCEESDYNYRRRTEEDLDRRYQRDQQDRANNLVVSDPPSKEELE